MAADQNQIIHLAQADGVRLLEGMAAGGEIDGMHRPAGLVTHRFPAAVQRVRLHHRAPASAVGIVIHLILLIGGIVPDLVSLNLNEAPLLRTAQNAVGKHIAQRLRKQGHNVNPHRFASLR